MKCKHCNGSGTTNMYINGSFADCMYCGGSGEVEQTNEEYIRSCSAEELAEFLRRIAWNCAHDCEECQTGEYCICDDDIANAVAWLQEEHKE